MPNYPVEHEELNEENIENHEAKEVSGEIAKNNIAAFAGNVWWGIKKGLAEVVMTLSQLVPDIIKKHYKGSMLEKGVNRIGKGIATAAGAVSNGAKKLGNGIKEGFKKLFPPDGKLVGFFKRLGGAIASGVKKAYAAVKKVGTKVITWAKGLVGKVKAAYEGSRLQKVVQKVTAPVIKVVSTVIGAVTFAAGKVVDKAKDIFGGVSFYSNDIKEEIFERNRQVLDDTYQERVKDFRTKQAIHDIKPSELKGEREQVLETLKNLQASNTVTFGDGDNENTVDVFDNISYLSDTNRLKEQLNNDKGLGEGNYEMRELNSEGKDIDLDVKHDGFTQKIDETNSKDIIKQKNMAEGKEEAPPVKIEYRESNHKISGLGYNSSSSSLIKNATMNLFYNIKDGNRMDSYQKNEGVEIKEKAIDKHYGKLLFEAATARKQVISEEKMVNVNVLVIAALCKATKSITGIDVDKIGSVTAAALNSLCSYIAEMANNKKLVINNIFGGEEGFKKAQTVFKMNEAELLHEVVHGTNCANLSQVADRIRLEQAMQIASNFNKGYAHGSEQMVEDAGLVNKDGTLDVDKIYKLLGGSLRIKDTLATRDAGKQGRTNKSAIKELEKRTLIRNNALETVQKKLFNQPTA